MGTVDFIKITECPKGRELDRGRGHQWEVDERTVKDEDTISTFLPS